MVRSHAKVRVPPASLDTTTAPQKVVIQQAPPQTGGVKIATILATGLAAVTVSAISTQLTGVFNSFILAGVVAMISAVVGDLYKKVAAGTVVAATKTAPPTTVTTTTPTPKTGAHKPVSPTRAGVRIALLFSAVLALTGLVTWVLFPSTTAPVHYRDIHRDLSVAQQEAIVSQVTANVLKDLPAIHEPDTPAVGATETPDVDTDIDSATQSEMDAANVTIQDLQLTLDTLTNQLELLQTQQDSQEETLRELRQLITALQQTQNTDSAGDTPTLDGGVVEDNDPRQPNYPTR